MYCGSNVMRQRRDLLWTEEKLVSNRGETHFGQRRNLFRTGERLTCRDVNLIILHDCAWGAVVTEVVDSCHGI